MDQTQKLRDVMAAYLLYRCKHLCMLKFRVLFPYLTKKMYTAAYAGNFRGGPSFVTIV